MSLSLGKLRDLLLSKGFAPNCYHVMDGSVFFIEILSMRVGETILLYIPSKYDFPLQTPEQIDAPVYKMKYLEVNPDVVKAKEEEDPGDRVNITPADGEVQEQLENNYRQGITLKEISKDDGQVMQTIYRQMRRLRFCVQNIKYKLGIYFRNYLCAIRRDDSIDCFNIKGYPRDDASKRLVVIVDLETFYEKNEKINDDVIEVRSSIYNLLQKNQATHAQILQTLARNRRDMLSIPAKLERKNIQYDTMISELQEMLLVMAKAEKEKLRQIAELQEKGLDMNINTDANRVHMIAKMEKELEQIRRLKRQIVDKMNVVRGKRDNVVLSMDKINFDNTTMFANILKNLGELKDFPV